MVPKSDRFPIDYKTTTLREPSRQRNTVSAERIKLHCLYTSNFEPMLVRFLSGFTDITELNLVNLSDRQEKIAGVGGGEELWRAKIDLLVRLAHPAHNPEPVIHLITDIDIMVYGAVRPVILEALAISEIGLQAEWAESLEANIGVIAFRPSAKAVYFWHCVREIVLRDRIWDQKAVNIVLRQLGEARFGGLVVSLFPKSVWALSQSSEVGFARCHDIVLHHANCVAELPQKWRQLSDFRRVFWRDRRNHDYAFGQVVKKLAEIEWEIGFVGEAGPYGRVRVDAQGVVSGIHDKNETRLLVGAQGLHFLNDEGDCTTFFDEFYFDPFRGKLLCAGECWARDRRYHYLLGVG